MTLVTHEIEDWIHALIIAKRDAEWESAEYWFYRQWAWRLIAVVDRRSPKWRPNG
jgi:hypothetical protein